MIIAIVCMIIIFQWHLMSIIDVLKRIATALENHQP